VRATGRPDSCITEEERMAARSDRPHRAPANGVPDGARLPSVKTKKKKRKKTSRGK
jgi:hypothetical protein